MKSIYAPKRGRKNLLVTGDMTRRELLRAGVGFAATLSGLQMIGGCATTETRKVIPSYSKIQAPQEGCLVGFFKEPDFHARPNASRFFPPRSTEIAATERAKNFEEFLYLLKRGGSFEQMERYEISYEIIYVEKALHRKPFIFVLIGPRLYSGFPMTQSMELAKRGVVPYVRAEIGPLDLPMSIPGFGLKEIAQGQHDSYIKKFAQGAKAFGNKHGGFFFNTMEEMNGNWYSWSKNPNFIPAWRHIWQIFEDEGANQYATWVWVVYCSKGVWVDDPELYYPGDKYLDWIGINAYSIAGRAYYTLDMLIRETYMRLSKNHPQKPIMVSGFARTNEEHQSRWLIDAYGKIKGDFPAIKAATYYDNTWTLTGNHTLNPNSWQTLKEIFKDSYWIMGK